MLQMVTIRRRWVFLWGGGGGGAWGATGKSCYLPPPPHLRTTQGKATFIFNKYNKTVDGDLYAVLLAKTHEKIAAGNF